MQFQLYYGASHKDDEIEKLKEEMQLMKDLLAYTQAQAHANAAFSRRAATPGVHTLGLQ